MSNQAVAPKKENPKEDNGAASKDAAPAGGNGGASAAAPKSKLTQSLQAEKAGAKVESGDQKAVSASNGGSQAALSSALSSNSSTETKSDAVAESGVGGEATITPDPSDSTILHPLHNRWAIFYTGAAKGGRGGKMEDSAKQWESNVKKVMDFDTVEAFWGLFNNLQPPSHLAKKTDYHVFKDGIRPAWEDKANERGGCWTMEFSDNRPPDELNQAWTFTVLAMIGEQFENSDEICGASVGIRQKRNRIQLWTRTANDQDAQMKIGKVWKSTIGLNMRVEFTAHSDNYKKPAPGARYVV